VIARIAITAAIAQEVIKSEQANKLVEKLHSTYMRPTDFSLMK